MRGEQKRLTADQVATELMRALQLGPFDSGDHPGAWAKCKCGRMLYEHGVKPDVECKKFVDSNDGRRRSRERSHLAMHRWIVRIVKRLKR
jgi:hypothetical protein